MKYHQHLCDKRIHSAGCVIYNYIQLMSHSLVDIEVVGCSILQEMKIEEHMSNHKIESSNITKLNNNGINME